MWCPHPPNFRAVSVTRNYKFLEKVSNWKGRISAGKGTRGVLLTRRAVQTPKSGSEKSHRKIPPSLARCWTTAVPFPLEMEKNLLWRSPAFGATNPLPWLLVVQAVADLLKGHKQLPSSQGNIRMSDFMNLLKVLAEPVLWISIFLLCSPGKFKEHTLAEVDQRKGTLNKF